MPKKDDPAAEQKPPAPQDDPKPADTQGRRYPDDQVPFKVMTGAAEPVGTPTPGLSFAAELRELENSQVPGLAGGGMVSHVVGPGQAPVDPIAAGLDTNFRPVVRDAARMITHTGTIGAGARPSTYAHTGNLEVPQAAPADGEHEPAVPSEEAAKSPGPNSTANVGAPVVKE